MICYLDSSVVVRKLFAEGSVVPGVPWGEWEVAYSSLLLRVEGFRTIDRSRLQGQLSDEEVARSVQLFDLFLESIGEIPISSGVLKRAASPFPTVVKTLDAIHLASALLWQDQAHREVAFLTHDQQLATAARALGFEVKGT